MHTVDLLCVNKFIDICSIQVAAKFEIIRCVVDVIASNQVI